MPVNLLALTTPIVKQVTPVIAETIKNKISPSEIQQAILAGLKAAESEEEKLPIEQHLFFRSKPDGFNGLSAFLREYFKITAVQNELAKSFNNQGKPDTDYLVAEFKRTAESFKEVNPIESRVEPWLTTFVNVYFQTTSTYLKLQVAKQNYFKQLNKRYDNIKFAGIAVSGQEEVKQLQKIFVMPDVVKREQNAAPLREEFILEELSPQKRLILEQKQLANLANCSSSPFLANKLLTETPFKRAVILGAPGSGKSTLVSYFAVMLTQDKAQDLGLDSNIDWLPIVIEIRDLERNLHLNLHFNILDYLHQFAESNLSTNKLPQDFFKHWLDRGNALILLDGVDEVADTGKRYKVVEKIESFLSQFDRNIAIITSRPSGYKRDFFSTAEFPHYQLQLFDDDKIEEFINHWYDRRVIDPQEANRCKDTLRKALEDNDRIKLLAKNPLLITIIALIHRYQAYLPKERHKLYDKAVETLLTSWDANKAISGHKVLKYLDLDDLRRLLESLAHWIHSQGSTGDKEGGTQIDKDELLEWLSKYIKTNKQRKLNEAREEAKRFLSFIRERTGLLNEQGTNRYAFVHKTFQEYLCAQDINYEADDEDDFDIVIECIKAHLHDAHWREILLLLVAQQKPQKALKAIKAIYENNSKYEQWLHRDLLFAGSCLADNPKGIGVKDKEGLVNKILQALVDLEVKEQDKIGSEILFQEVFQVIVSLVETDWKAKVLKLLKKQKNKIDIFRFLEYQAALGEQKQAITTFLFLLQDNNYLVRFSAVCALGNIGKYDSEVIHALLSLLQDNNSAVRLGASRALGNIGKYEPKMVTKLLSLFHDNDLSVCLGATDALGKIGKYEPKITNNLLTLIYDDSSHIRSCAANVLGKIGKYEPEVIRALLSLLQDDLSVCSSAACALGNIGKDEPEVIHALLSLLHNNDSHIRSSAARALGNIGQDEPEVIHALLSLLQDNLSVCSSAACALGNIGKDEPEVIRALLSLLQDHGSYVRSCAAQALGNIRTSEPEVIRALLPMLHDNDSYVRSCAAQALGKIGKAEPEVIHTLLPMLHDNDSYVSSCAAQALGNMGKAEPEMITLIETWLEQHQDTEYAGNGIDVLWNLVVDAG